MNIAWAEEPHRDTTLRDLQERLEVAPGLDSSAHWMRVLSETTDAGAQMHPWDPSPAIDLILRS